MKKILLLLLICYLFAACKSSSHTQKQETVTSSKTTQAPIVKDTGKPRQIVELPVFIPILELQNQLYQSFFAPNYGKFFPCDGHPDCDDSYKNLYLEQPVLKVDGSHIVIKMHLAGKADLVILSTDVSSDITLTALPSVKNDTLYFKDLTMDHSSNNILLKIASKLFEKRIISAIQKNAWYAFRPKLDAMTADTRKKFPLKWGNICLLLDLGKINMKQVSTSPAPNEGIMADFSAELTIEDATFCGQ
jgi:hypothetical protein